MAINFGQNPNLSGYTPAAVTTPPAAPFNDRILLDANYIQNIALPNAANVANTNAIDLLQDNPFPTSETINVQLVIGTATNTANSKNINAALQTTTANTDGTPNSANWVNIPTLAAVLLVTVDNAGGGNPGGNVVVKLPPGQCKRFIRGQFTGEANGGVAAGNGTVQLLF